GRAARLHVDGHVLWIAAERRSLGAIVWPSGRFEPDLVEPPARRAPAWSDREGAQVEIIRARLGLVGPVTAPALAAPLGLTTLEVDSALARLGVGPYRGGGQSPARSFPARRVHRGDRVV